MLPVLHRIKQEREDAEIHTVFPSDRFFQESARNPSLLSLLEEVSTQILRPLPLIGVETDWATDYVTPLTIVERFPSVPHEVAQACQNIQRLGLDAKASFERGQLSLEEFQSCMGQLQQLAAQMDQVLRAERETRTQQIEDEYLRALFDGPLRDCDFDLILRDNCADFRLHFRIFERLPEVPVVRGEHGFDMTNRTLESVDETCREQNRKSEVLSGRSDLWLCCRKRVADLLTLCRTDAATAVVGYPRLDREWQEVVVRASQQEVMEAGVPDDRPVILWITRPIAASYCNEESWTRITRATLRVFRQQPDFHVIVKAHPRQELERLHQELSELPRDRWTLWKGCTTSAASRADIAVSVWSSAVMDVLALGKPVIEFFEYAKESFVQARRPDGKISGGWREQGLVAPADSEADVHRLLELWRRNPEDSVWLQQRQAYARLHPVDADHTGLAVRAIARAVFEHSRVAS